MKLTYKIKYRCNTFALCLLICTLTFTACKKFIDIDPPITSINAGNVYNNDATATAVLTGIYINIDNENLALNFYGHGLAMSSLWPGLSSDELTLFAGAQNSEAVLYYQNSLQANLISNSDFWMPIYKYLFTINSAIVGLNASSKLTSSVKSQLLGEAYFMRAFCYFHLVNLYGDVPLITSSDYNVTALQARNSKADIYALIKTDLIKAQNLLSEGFLDGTLLKSTSERVRPNKYAATALLSRAYLYTNEWANAETESTKIINNKLVYDLVGLNDVFLKNSKESIWSLQPVGVANNSNTGEGKLFILPSTGPDGQNYSVYLSDHLVKSFEPGDQRYNNWINSVNAGGATYYYPFKYKIGDVPSVTSEYPIILRLAEQYLIRAESRIQQGNISGGIDDLNALRTRATDLTAPVVQRLKQLSKTLSKDDALKAVLHERQVELFTEWGHRWFDLRRTGTIDSVMTPVTREKGGVWDSRWSVYPIPTHEIINNQNLVQNPGY